ncbi:hypothetical protein HMPREF9057_02252 [Actinomyces sp. oral taxon 171 str. F0337]|nr:hypothetical protein HMPREF9057_02252 [Actinomyces sp. oral taxon 171 str. F0337]
MSSGEEVPPARSPPVRQACGLRAHVPPDPNSSPRTRWRWDKVIVSTKDLSCPTKRMTGDCARTGTGKEKP